VILNLLALGVTLGAALSAFVAYVAGVPVHVIAHYFGYGTGIVFAMPFSGKATTDNFAMIGEDVSDILLNLSPTETPFLDLLPAPDVAGTNILHQWSEEALGPDRIIASTAVNSATADTGVQVNGFGLQMVVGQLLELENQGEVVQVKSIPGANSLLLTRNFGSRGVSSLAAGGNLFVISTAELEGSETSGDVTRPRTRRSNYMQIFKKPVAISGSDRSVITAPDIGDEMDHQVTLRVIEVARDFEKAIFRSVQSGNSIGTTSAYRTFDGLRQWFTAINSTITSSSFAANPLDYTNDQLQNAWNAGARDLDVIPAGPQWKRELSATNAAKILVDQADRSVQRVIEYIQTDFGTPRLVLTPWLPDRHLMCVASRRVRPVPLRGRSFQRVDLAKTGDNDKAHVVGEYSVEVHHPDKQAQLHT
jgi:hypothetical protein